MLGSNEYSMNPALVAKSTASPFYRTQTFDKDVIFKQRYGTNASWRDKLRFERYWNSLQRIDDELAHAEEERKKYLASIDAYTQKALNKVKEVPAPEFYKTKDFRTTKLAEMYGTDPSKRDLRQFERYIQSEQGLADWLAHELAEMKKYRQSWDDYIAANQQRINQVLDNAKLLLSKSAVISKPKDSRKKEVVNTSSTVSVKPRTTDWNQIARDNAFKDIAEVKEHLKMLGVTVDGKWGNKSKAAMQLYLALVDKGWKQETAEDGSAYFIDPTTNERVWATGRREAGQPVTLIQLQKPKLQKPKLRVKRYDPTGPGDFYISDTGLIYRADWGGGVGELLDPNLQYETHGYADAYRKAMQDYKNRKAYYQSYKQGGQVNRINYFQQGGATQPSVEEQVISLVQAAIQGDLQATLQVEEILAKAQQGDPQAAQLAQLIQQALESLKGLATRAKWGAKLGYIQHLKSGKKTCPECGLPVEKKACGGKKAKKKYFGGWL